MKRLLAAALLTLTALVAPATAASAATPYHLTGACYTSHGYALLLIVSHGTPPATDPEIDVFRGVNDHGGVYRTAYPNHWYLFYARPRQVEIAYWVHVDPTSGILLVDGSVTVRCGG